MNSTVKSLLIFSAGVTIGVGLSWDYFRRRCEKLINENETEYGKEEKPHEERIHTWVDDAPNVEFENDEVRKEYEDFVRKSDYTKSDEEEKTMETKYIITAEEFDTDNGYQKEILEYYADHILVDDFNHRIDDTDFLVGIEECEIFKYFDSDRNPIFVRNDFLKIDFEIDFTDEYFEDDYEDDADD